MTHERFVARLSKGRVLMLVLLGLAIIATCAWLFSIADSQHRYLPVMVQAVAILGGLFFGAVTLSHAQQLWKTRPVIEIGPDGIAWRRLSDALIPWRAIERAEVRPQRGESVLALWLADPEQYRPRTLYGLLQRFGTASGYGHVSLTTQAMDRRFDEMIDAMRAFAPRLGLG